MTISADILEDILDEAKTYALAGRSFLAVFDLDSTLLDLTPRVINICSEFAADPSVLARFPKECRRLADLEIRSTDWGINEGLQRIGFAEAVNTEFWRTIHDHWSKSFFSNDFLHHDVPLPGASEYVLELRHLGSHIMYLTGRDIPRMLEGTRTSLEAQGFPIDAHDAQLVLKPDKSMNDARFKVDVLKEAAKTYERIWLFENEPVNTNLVAAECPEVGIVFIETTHSGREEPAGHLVKIPDFSRPRKVKS